jgi:hypothetical protein
VTPRPRVVRGAVLASAGALLLMAGGCSHYHVGIPLVPGLSLGLGATKDGNFSVGLNTGFGPLGAGVAMNNSGQVTGSAGAGVGLGPVSTGVGKGAVLYDPKAAPAGIVAAAPVAPGAVVAPAAAAPAAPAAPATPGGQVQSQGLTPVRYSTPAAPFTPIEPVPFAQVPGGPALSNAASTANAARGTRAATVSRAPLVKITRPPPEPVAPAVNVTYRTPAGAATAASPRDAGTPGNPVAP